jgi:adenylate kinase family enzyme
MKYLKWAFGTSIGHKENEHFEIGKEIEADMWDPDNDDWDKRGGFNFTNEECALRWMSRGDTLYEVTIPSDGELKEVKNDKTPGGIIIANKIILTNPIPISNELLIELYKKSSLPIETYFESIGLLASRGYYDIALIIIKDKVRMDNIDLAINEFNSSLKPWHKVDYDCYNKVKEVLEEIKSSVDINLFIDKEPYIKKLSDDKIINLTGQSGSGKTTYAKDNFNSQEYLLIDTDDIFSDERFNKTSGINKELGEYFRNKYETLPNCGDDFDLIYKEIIDYCKKYDKTIVIDCAQFHCIKDINLLKGTLIVIRTCINNCYNRTIERFKSQNANYTEEELETYMNKKKAIYKWYKYSNKFLEQINKEGEFIETK